METERDFVTFYVLPTGYFVSNSPNEVICDVGFNSYRGADEVDTCILCSEEALITKVVFTR